MDQQVQGQSQGSGQQSDTNINTNEVEQIMGNPSQGSLLTSSAAASFPRVQAAAGSQFAGTLINSYPQMHQKREIEIRQRLKTFWDNQIQEIKKITDFKNHNLPLARIKKIMKADEDVKMISAEAPMVFAKACEMFILELTLRSWCNTEENKRRTLLRNDVIAAIAKTDIFDFLVDIIPREDVKDEPLLSMPGNAMSAVAVSDPQAYYHVPVPQQLAHSTITGDIMNRRAVDPNFFGQHIPGMAPVFWYPQEQQDEQQDEQQQQQQQQQPQSASDS